MTDHDGPRCAVCDDPIYACLPRTGSIRDGADWSHRDVRLDQKHDAKPRT